MRRPLAFLALLAACTAPPAGPPLLPPDQIALATQGTTAVPDIAPLQARAARLAARAADLRRTTLDGFEARRLSERARRLAQG